MPERKVGGSWRTYLSCLSEAVLRPVHDKEARHALEQEVAQVSQAVEEELPVLGRGAAFAYGPRLNRQAFEHAKDLITKRRFVTDRRNAWSEHQPSAADENDFVRMHGFDEFGKWHLGLNDEKDPHTKGRHEFPYGDFVDVHRCAVLSAESRAGQYKHYNMEKAAAHLHGMIDAASMNFWVAASYPFLLLGFEARSFIGIGDDKHSHRAVQVHPDCMRIGEVGLDAVKEPCGRLRIPGIVLVAVCRFRLPIMQYELMPSLGDSLCLHVMARRIGQCL